MDVEGLIVAYLIGVVLCGFTWGPWFEMDGTRTDIVYLAAVVLWPLSMLFVIAEWSVQVGRGVDRCAQVACERWRKWRSVRTPHP